MPRQKITTFLWYDQQAEEAVMDAMLQMDKLDIAKLEQAYAG
ncbi:MAG: hypothetical protein WDZ51_18830 [Pirellulaceae bacterium]